MRMSPNVFLANAAKATSIPPSESRAAALATVEEHQAEDIWFKTFRLHGKQFAVSTRLAVEVDYFPHRVPARVLTTASHTRAR